MPAYAVHRACITSFDESRILYDGAETWTGDSASGGALLFEEGCAIGMHLDVVETKPSFESDSSASLPIAGGLKRRTHADIELHERVKKLSVASSSHGKICVALRLTHRDVLAAVELVRSAGGRSAAAGSSGGGRGGGSSGGIGGGSGGGSAM